MKSTARRIALTSILAALIIIFNAMFPIGPIYFFPLRILSTTATMIVSIIDPWAGAFGALIGHFSYDYTQIGLGAAPALFNPWCYVVYGYLMKRQSRFFWPRALIGSVICVAWISFTLTMGFWLLSLIPPSIVVWPILSTLTLTFIFSNLILIPILPRLRSYTKSQNLT